MTSIYARLAIIGLAMLGYSASPLADTTTSHVAGPYKMAKFGNSGENIPLNGPVIHVFSSNGKSYDKIANDNENLRHASTISGICGRRAQEFSSASLEVAGTSHAVSGSGGHTIAKHTESFEFPFALPDIARQPAAACNFELDKRVAQGNRDRDYWMAHGFVVRYENAYEATFSASCAGGAARGEFARESIKTPVWIACAPIGGESKSKPNSAPARVAKSRARPMPLKVSAKLQATQQGSIYAKECPVRVTYSGSIFVSQPNTRVRYRIVGTGWQSPERTITIAESGSQDISGWTQRYREKQSTIGRVTSTAGTDREADASGTVRLKVEYDGGMAESEAISYEVFCNAEPPKATIRLNNN